MHGYNHEDYSDVFPFTQEPSSGSNLVLRQNYNCGFFAVLVIIDMVNVMEGTESSVPSSTVNHTPAQQADMLP